MGRRGRLILIVVATIIVALILLSALVNILTDRYWFAEVHYSRVFSTMLWTRVVMFFVVGIVIGGIVGGNLYLAYRLRPLLRPTRPSSTPSIATGCFCRVGSNGGSASSPA